MAASSATTSGRRTFRARDYLGEELAERPPRLRTPEQRAEMALRFSYGVVLPRLQRSAASGGLGFARPSYETGLCRNGEFMMDLAEDLRDWWRVLVRDDQESESETARRVVRRHQDDVVLGLVGWVGWALLTPARRVVEARAGGATWKVLARRTPDRPLFSMKDDWDGALRRVVAERWADVEELT